MTWERGDQAMCIKPFRNRVFLHDPPMTYDGPLPSPPLVYEVTEALPAPEGMLDDPAPFYLGFRETESGVLFDCRHFRKLEPLDPEQVDEPERVPEPV